MAKVTKLKNGLTVITEKRKTEEVSIGVLVKTGMLNETDEQNGISHFLEHMAFKGTADKTAKELAEDIEKLGGYCNAFTSADCTLYYVNMLADYWKAGVNFLSDIVLHSVFPDEEIERERDVILQEIARSKDTVEHVFFDKAVATLYPNQAFGRTVLGPAKNVKAFTRQDLINYVKERYCPNNMIVSACGNISHRKFVKEIKKYFKDLKMHKVLEAKPSEFKVARKTYKSRFEQTTVGLFFKGITASSEDKTVMNVFNTVLDGGMSCRLFQEVREKNGLCYTTSSIVEKTKTDGFFGVFAGIKKENVDKCYKVFEEVLESMKTDITDAEIQKAKNTILYSIVQGMNLCTAVMQSNALEYAKTNKPVNIKERIKKVKAVTKQQVLDFANKYIDLSKQSRVTLTSK